MAGVVDGLIWLFAEQQFGVATTTTTTTTKTTTNILEKMRTVFFNASLGKKNDSAISNMIQ